MRSFAMKQERLKISSRKLSPAPRHPWGTYCLQGIRIPARPEKKRAERIGWVERQEGNMREAARGGRSLGQTTTMHLTPKRTLHYADTQPTTKHTTRAGSRRQTQTTNNHNNYIRTNETRRLAPTHTQTAGCGVPSHMVAAPSSLVRDGAALLLSTLTGGRLWDPALRRHRQLAAALPPAPRGQRPLGASVAALAALAGLSVRQPLDLHRGPRLHPAAAA